MSPIAPGTAIRDRPHWVTFETPGPPVADGLGGFTDGPAVQVGAGFARIQSATGGDQQRTAAGTVLSHASYIVSLPYLVGVGTRAVMKFFDARINLVRTFNVVGVVNDEERGTELVLVVDEIVP